MAGGFSFSWKRALGISAAKSRLSRELGIPLTSSGRQRKVGRMASGWFSTWLVESSYQALRSGKMRSQRTVEHDEVTPAAPETLPRRPSIVGTAFTCLGAAMMGGIAALLFQSTTAFWVVTGLIVGLLVADHRNRAEKWRDCQTSSDAAQPPLPPSVDEPTLTSRDGANMPQMRQQLETEHRPIDRHFLLLNMVESAYRGRKHDPAMREMCEQLGFQHVEEFPAFAPALLKEFGMLPRVPTFQHLATVLTERGEFGRAIEVCQTALSLGLHDNTIGGFEGRIERIRSKSKRCQPAD
jgi:hypothetical protein